jgi:hypothetical protein
MNETVDTGKQPMTLVILLFLGTSQFLPAADIGQSMRDTREIKDLTVEL